ncbi:MAG: DUF4249 domain-containing protein [Niabella sp.]
MLKKYNISLLLIWCIAALLTSCEKIINADIKNVEKKYVIEAQITDNENSARVNLSQTINMADSNQFTGVENAEIYLNEDNSLPIKLTHTGGGVYRANVTGKPGKTYHLTINVNGQTFTAVSTMPQKVNFDTLYVSERLFLGQIRKVATVEFTDPPNIKNAYRFIQYIDGRKENTIFITDDNLIDGRKVIYELLIFGDTDYTLKSEDQLRVEMRGIDMPAYKFWYSLTQSSLGQNQSASPGNPITNIQGGAIGYFSAQTFEAKSMAVK